MARSYVDAWLDTQALDKHNKGNQNRNNITLNRTQVSGLKYNKNNWYKPNYNKNQDSYRKRECPSDDDLDDGYQSFYINELEIKYIKRKELITKNQG